MTYASTGTNSPAGVCQCVPGLLPVSIGPDVSGNFVISLYGLAVNRPDGRAVLHRDGELIDVSLFVMPMPAASLGVYGIPVSEVHYGELIKISDCPYSLLYVLEVTPSGFRGLDPFMGTIVYYTEPVSPFFTYFVRMESIYGLLFTQMEETEEAAEVGESDWTGLSPQLLLLLLSSCQSSNTSASLTTLLFFLQALGRSPYDE